jgi:hypothetical protein
MKKIIPLIVLLLAIFSSNAQQFSFELYLSDMQGNADTLILGYDVNASDSIDSQFGEIDILNNPWDSIFEARISPLTEWMGPVNNHNPQFQLKKQILNFNPKPPYNPLTCNSSSPVYIEIYSASGRPFSLKWDSTKFMDSSNFSSGFVFINQIIHQPAFHLNSVDSLVFDNWPTNDSYYLSNGETIWLLGFAFISYTEVGINEVTKNETENVIIYPNPASEIINIEFKKSLTDKSEIQLFDISGKLFFKQEIINKDRIEIDISHLNSGVYIIEINSENGFSERHKLIKKH